MSAWSKAMSLYRDSTFEWAWQHPDKSRRLRTVAVKSRKETAFQFRWRVVCQMLRTPPWTGLCLTIRWLKQDFRLDFPLGLEPPFHMPIQFGPIVSKKITKGDKKKKESSKNKNKNSDDVVTEETEAVTLTETSSPSTTVSSFTSYCTLCLAVIKPTDASMQCLFTRCDMKCHMMCLASHFISDPNQLLPVEGSCPECKRTLLWGDLVRQRKGCYQNMNITAMQSESSIPVALDSDIDEMDL